MVTGSIVHSHDGVKTRLNVEECDNLFAIGLKTSGIAEPEIGLQVISQGGLISHQTYLSGLASGLVTFLLRSMSHNDPVMASKLMRCLQIEILLAATKSGIDPRRKGLGKDEMWLLKIILGGIDYDHD